jgi:hypothetical protein
MALVRLARRLELELVLQQSKDHLQEELFPGESSVPSLQNFRQEDVEKSHPSKGEY